MFVTLKVFKLIGPSNDGRRHGRGTYLFPLSPSTSIRSAQPVYQTFIISLPVSLPSFLSISPLYPSIPRSLIPSLLSLSPSFSYTQHTHSDHPAYPNNPLSPSPPRPPLLPHASLTQHKHTQTAHPAYSNNPLSLSPPPSSIS
jgi:hypothetical protein